MRYGMIWTVLLCLAACDGGSKDDEDKKADKSEDKADDKKADKGDDKKADKGDEKAADKPAAPASATAAAPTASAAPVASVKPPPPGPESQGAPAISEWDAAKEVTVKGSSALNCETKVVRGWFRASCRGKNDSGGTPTTVHVSKSSDRAKTFTFASGGVTSVVMPYAEGAHLEATFSWTDKSHKLVLDWPRGQKRQPEIVGVYEGAASPLDNVAAPGTESWMPEFYCKCEREMAARWGAPIPESTPCSELESFDHPDCARTYRGDCEMYHACARGEPAVPPSCLPGNMLLFGRFCAKECKVDGDCPAKFTCGDPYGDEQYKVCIEP